MNVIMGYSMISPNALYYQHLTRRSRSLLDYAAAKCQN